MTEDDVCDKCGHRVHGDAEVPARAAPWNCPACRFSNDRPLPQSKEGMQ
mgnify:CR=1 FL=1